MKKQIAHFPGPNGGYYVESWMDKKGHIQIRVCDNEDALDTRIEVSGAGIERAWYPGSPRRIEIDNSKG